MDAELARRFKDSDEIGRYDLFVRLYQSDRLEDRRALEGLFASDDQLLKMILVQYLEDVPQARAVRWLLSLLDDDNAILREAVFRTYARNPYPRKHRLLIARLRDPKIEVACFAVRSLSRQGVLEIAPVLLDILPGASEELRREVLSAFRYVYDPRALPLLLEAASSPDEQSRYRAVKTLSSLLDQGWSVPRDPFLAGLRDPSARVREASLRSLERFPARAIARMFLEKALGSGPVSERRGAIQALGAFPRAEWVAPLVGLLAREEGELRLSVEIALRHFPRRVLKAGLLPLLSSPEPAARREGALLAASALGEDPEVRRRVLALWNGARELPEKLALIEVLRELGGEDVLPLLFEAMASHPLAAYAAAEALNRLATPGSGLRVLGLLKDPALPLNARQALLDGIVRRGPEPMIREPLLSFLLEGLRAPVMNIRYLAVQALAWYPLPDCLGDLLSLLGRETDSTVRATIRRVVLKGLGSDPALLVDALRASPPAGQGAGETALLIASRPWDPEAGRALLSGLAAEPLLWPEREPAAFRGAAIHLVARGAVPFSEVWAALPAGEGRERLLEEMIALRAWPDSGLPPLESGGLLSELSAGGPRARSLLYRLLGADGRPERIATLVGLLLKEEDPPLLELGRRELSRLVWGAAPA